MNLKSKNNIIGGYGRNKSYGTTILTESSEDEHLKNKVLQIDSLNSYVKNYLKNSSFETNQSTFTTNSQNINISYSTDYSETGFKSMKVINSALNQEIFQNISVPKEKNYTFSLYIKNNNNAKISLRYINIDNRNK